MSTHEPPSDSTSLFATLAGLIERGEHEGLMQLCQQRTQEIREGFGEWKQVPAEIRSDPSAVQRYAKTLITVAQLFAQGGDPSLLERLTGPAEDNPLVQWEQALDRARAAMGANEHDAAHEQLEALLARTEELSGSGADQLRAITIGLLGQAAFHRGDVRAAVEHFEDALRRCEAQDDAQGRAVYLGALYEAYRWLGERSVAAQFAARLAEHHAHSDPEQAEHWRERAAAVVDEPPVRVRVQVDGIRLDPDALPADFQAEGSIRFVFERNRLRLGAVAALLERGRAQGSAKQLEDALASFTEAARIDPRDPDPEYLRGQTLLHLGRFAEAAKAYQRTESIAPGWYHCRTDGWIAQQLAAGALPTDVFEQLVAIERPSDEPALVERAQRAGAQWPNIAPLRLAEGRVLLRADQTTAAEAAFRAGLDAAAEPDVRTRLLVELAQVVMEPERTERLMEAVQLAGNRVARAMAQVMLHSRPRH